MELDDFKNTWKEVNPNKPTMVNPEMLDKMKASKYRAKLKKITVPEMIGCAVCLGAAVFIGWQFHLLDTVFLQVVGLISILLLVLLPLISFISTSQLSKTDHLNMPYAETLKLFAMQKIRFIKLQKLNVTLSYLLLVTVIVLLSKLFNGIDISNNKYFWIFSFTIGYIFLQFYSRWVVKHYGKTLQQAEALLKELAPSNASV